MLGNLWRFDFDDLVAPAGAEVTKLATFQIGDHAAADHHQAATDGDHDDHRHQGPSDRGWHRALPRTSDVTDTTQQSIYAIKDPLSGAGWGDVRSRVDLVSQTVTNSGVNGTGSSNAVDWSTKIGWKMDLPQSKEARRDRLRAAVQRALDSQRDPRRQRGAIRRAVRHGCTRSKRGQRRFRRQAGPTCRKYLGAFLVVGMTSIKTADGHMKIEIVGSDAAVPRQRAAAARTWEPGRCVVPHGVN